jgi:simple sugar transport system permease protein
MMALPDVAQLLDLVPVLLRVTTPILPAALGVHISQRAGVLNLGIEGTMLSAALAAVLASAATGNPWIGLLGALAIGALLGMLLSLAIHVLKADLILSGIAINMLASAGTTLVLYMATGDKGMSGSLSSGTLPSLTLPLVADLPVLGKLLSGHHVLTYAAFLLVPAVTLLMTRTPFGIRLRAVGENAEAAATAGIDVVRMQVTALVLSGLCAGAAGAFLSMGYVSWFSQNMSAGRGFVALAADLMGQGSAYGTMAASLLLGAADAVGISLQGKGLPAELLQALPYLVPIVALVIHARTRRKRALHS